METELTHHHEWQDAGSANGVELAVRRAISDGVMSGDKSPKPGFVWLGGFRSDMTGTKAQVMVDHAVTLGCSSLRFDYSGHGESGGAFTDGTISRWVDESLSVLLAQTEGPQVLIGSSMGGWIALRLCEKLAERGEAHRVAALILIAPAPDFTQRLMEPAFSDAQKVLMAEQGYIEEPSAYSEEPNIITAKLIEDGRENCLMDRDIHMGVPIHILQGTEDPDVPMDHAITLKQCLPHDNVALTLVKGGDHRLSRDEDLELLKRTMSQMLERVAHGI